MKRVLGFTLVEVVTVISIISVVSALAIPPLLRWKQHADLRGSAAKLAASVQLARTHAMAKGDYVVIKLKPDSCQVFVDNGEGGALFGDWTRSGSERLLRDFDLHQSISCTTTFPADRFRFKGIGRNQPGTITLTHRNGEKVSIVINVLGRIRVVFGS